MLKIPDLHNWRTHLTPKVKNELQAFLTTKTFKANDVLYAAGDPTDYCYQIEHGRIRVCNYHYEGREIILTHFHSNDCFGDLGLLSDSPRTNYAIADIETKVNMIKSKDLKDLCAMYPEILWQMNKYFSYRIELMLSLIEEASLLPLYGRIIKVLVRLGLSVGETDKDGNTVIKDLSQETLSRMVGATRQSVAREIKQMQGHGLIKAEYGRFLVPDIEKLNQRFKDIISHHSIVPSYSGQGEPPEKQ